MCDDCNLSQKPSLLNSFYNMSLDENYRDVRFYHEGNPRTSRNLNQTSSYFKYLAIDNLDPFKSYESSAEKSGGLRGLGGQFHF